MADVGVSVGKVRPVLTVVAEDGARREDVSLLDDVVREGARRMLAAALEAEVDACLAELADERDERGRRLVVRNGYAQPREVMTAAGAVQVRAPRVNDKRVDARTGERKRFRSVILPPWCRRSPKVAECCRCCTCTGCRPATSCPLWRVSWVRRPACPPRRSPGWPSPPSATGSWSNVSTWRSDG
jgi:Transposase, Mutator family